MPQTFSNDIGVVKYTEYIVPLSRVAKKPTPEPWSLPAFSLIKINNYNNPREPNIPLSLNRHNPLALFKPFFTNLIVKKIVEWTNKHTKLHRLVKKERLIGREHL